MTPFDDTAGEFFFSRGGDAAVDSGQIDESHFRSKGAFAPPSGEADSDSGIVRRTEAASGQGIHQCSLAGIRHTDEANGGGSGRGQGGGLGGFGWGFEI